MLDKLFWSSNIPEFYLIVPPSRHELVRVDRIKLDREYFIPVAAFFQDSQRLHQLIIVHFNPRQDSAHGKPLPVTRVRNTLVLIIAVQLLSHTAVIHLLSPSENRPV